MNQAGIAEAAADRIATRPAESTECAPGIAAPAASSLTIFTAVAVFELRMASRSRWTIATSAVFLAAALAVSYFGLFGAGYLEFQGFERTATSLLSLVIYVSPLLGLVLGLDSFTSREGSDLLFSEPTGRGAIVLGKLAGLTATVAAALFAGLGAAGLLIAAETGADGIEGYLVLVATAVGLAASFAGLAALASFALGDRLQASGAVLGAWLWFVLLHELVILGAMFLVPETAVRPLLVTSLFGSPVSLARVATLLALDAQPVLGAGGALLLRLFGPAGAQALLLAGLAAWAAVPWCAATLVARRRDAAM